MSYFQGNPNHPSLNTKTLTVSSKRLKELGVDQIYEFYINRKDYRCIFYVIHDTKEIIIAYIGNHTQVKNKF
jgi:mRNA-degrading endonuclease HigB of HigAB toxin-antitoxin module